MTESTFDVAIHLGPGVATINNQNEETETRFVDNETDPNKSEVKCSCGLFFGIGMTICIGVTLLVVLVLYLFCKLDYQVGEKCYYLGVDNIKSNLLKQFLNFSLMRIILIGRAKNRCRVL